MDSSTIAINWHKPDNTANLFTAISCAAHSHVYRFTVNLQEAVYPRYLQEALEDVLPYFRAFNVRLKKSAFQNVFEQQEACPLVEEDEGYICRHFEKKGNGFLFRVLYGGKQIHLEAFHGLTDGTGAVYFIRALTYRYLQLAYASQFTKEECEKLYGVEQGLNVEDAYALNYRKKKGRLPQYRSYCLDGERRGIGSIGCMKIEIPVSKLKEVSKRHGATIGEYLATVTMLATKETYPKNYTKPINIEFPVNLRPIFQTDTSLNFFANINLELKPEEFSYGFPEILQSFQRQIKEKVKKENFERQFGFTVWGEQCTLAQVTPVIVREWFLRRMYDLHKHHSTIGFSNVGNVKLEPLFAKYITSMESLAAPSIYVPVKIVSCSVNDVFTMTLTTKLTDHKLPDAIVKKLEEHGVEMKVDREYEK